MVLLLDKTKQKEYIEQIEQYRRKEAIRIKKLTTGQVAEIFSVSKPTVSRWCKKGDLSYFTTPGGHKRITRESVNGLWQTYFIRGVPTERGVKEE